VTDFPATWLRIGQFAYASGLTVKALRYYDRTGVLVPARVDLQNGYRWYSSAQLEDAATIRGFRAVQVPVSELAALLEAGDEARRSWLSSHRDRLAATATDSRRVLAELDRMIERREEAPMEEVSLEIREERELRLASVIKHVRQEDIPAMLFSAFDFTLAWARARGSETKWAPIAVYRAGDADGWALVEAGFPVERGIDGDHVVNVHVYPPTRSVSSSYQGPWPEFDEYTQRFVTTVFANGYRPILPNRVVYLTDMATETDPEKWAARVYWPIASDIEPSD
jgi:DNA-binding transcriptional MerR regulator